MSPHRAYHRLQARPDGCVRACFEVVLARTNPGAEPPVHVEPDLYGSPDFEAATGAQRLVLELGYRGVDQLRVALAAPAWVIAVVCGPVWVSLLGDRRHPTHGSLCAPGPSGRPFHAVVVVEESAGAFVVIDPWCAAEGQPVSAPVDAFVEQCVAGQTLVVPLP